MLPSSITGGVRRFVESNMTIGPPGRLRAPRRNILKLLRGIDLPHAERYLSYSSYYRPEELQSLLHEDLHREYAHHDPFRRHRDLLSRVSDQHWLNQLLYLDMKTFLPCLNLAYTDKMSMAASAEVRVPLLDDELVALAARIPPELKLHWTRRKLYIKRAVESRLPHGVVWRPKAGFSAPIRSWLVGALRPMVHELLSEERVEARGLFKPNAVARLIADFESARADNALRIWALLTLEIWQQQYLDGSSASGRPLQVWP